MRVLSSIELPHWLMIAGAILIAMGFLGLAFTRYKEAATTRDSGSRRDLDYLLSRRALNGGRARSFGRSIKVAAHGRRVHAASARGYSVTVQLSPNR